MNWGARIVLSFIGFAIIVFTMVFISINQEINLVAEDYYKQEIEYEGQIQRIRNTNSLKEQPDISLDKATLMIEVMFPKDMVPQIQDGNIHLFRPSDSRLDKHYKLAINEDGIQKISISGRLKGLWKVKLFWKDGKQEYYKEKILTF